VIKDEVVRMKRHYSSGKRAVTEGKTCIRYDKEGPRRGNQAEKKVERAGMGCWLSEDEGGKETVEKISKEGEWFNFKCSNGSICLT